MKRNSRLALALIASTVALGGVTTEFAQAVPPRSSSSEVKLTRQAISRISKLSTTSERTIEGTASSRIALLEKLKSRGADDNSIISVANASKASITAIRVRLQNQLVFYVDSVIVRIEGADKHLPIVTAGAIASLQQQFVADDLIATVETARDIGIARVTDAEIQALTDIDAKVAELTAAPMP